jgi:anti-repressor protein
MNDIIKINNNKVSGRALYEFLKVGTAYKDWLLRMCEYGFAEGEKFIGATGE